MWKTTPQSYLSIVILQAPVNYFLLCACFTVSVEKEKPNFFPRGVYDCAREGDKYLSCGKICVMEWAEAGHCNCCSLMAVALNSSQCFPFFILY